MFLRLVLIVVAITAQVSYAKQCAEENACVFFEDRDGGFLLSARNDNSFDITMELKFELNNISVQPINGVDNKYLFVVSANSHREVAKLVIENEHQKSQYGYSIAWLPGDISAKHEADALYSLPYKVGKTFYVSQSCDGRDSHRTPGNQYAIDFAMPVGTPIHAARGGKVVNLHEVSISGGTSTMNYDEGNFLQIKHRDGTLASYHHLRTMGVKVELGDTVEQGDFIGYSGNTGFTSGPHLHFVVQKPSTVRSTESFPLKWNTARGVLSCPREGLALRSVKR